MYEIPEEKMEKMQQQGKSIIWKKKPNLIAVELM